MRTLTSGLFGSGLLASDRQRIDTPWLYLLLAVAIFPLLIMAVRLMAVSAVGPQTLVLAGDWLNRHFTLQWVGFEDRDVILYILLLPLAALLIALTRLTLGLRILGFRSILIAIGIQELGVLPCLLLISLIGGTVILVRPVMRRSGMPLYARVAVVLCIVAFTMLGGLLAGVWLDSVTLWSMAFFPVVILAMLAESVADTVARDGLAMAVWRTSTTIALALVIAGLNQLTPLRELVLLCPEVLLTPLVLIVFVSEFLDLRLFEGYRAFAKVSDRAATEPLLVLVRNRFPESSPRRAAGDVPRRYRKASLQTVIDQLRERGYQVSVLECDATLPGKLHALARAAWGPGGAGLCVLNYSGGGQGSSRLIQVPVICELLGVPHTGPGAQAVVLSADRRQQMVHLHSAGLRVPLPLSLDDAQHALADEDVSLWVRPLFQTDRGAVRVSNLQQLKAACKRCEKRFGEAVIERIPPGRPLTVVVRDPGSAKRAKVLPILKRASGLTPFSRSAKLSAEEHQLAASSAIRAARALGCRDVTRVDLYCSESGEVTVANVFAVEPLTARSAIGVAARLGGLALAEIAEDCLRAAMDRASNTPRVASPSSSTPGSQNLNPEKWSAMTCATSASSATV